MHSRNMFSQLLFTLVTLHATIAVAQQGKTTNVGKVAAASTDDGGFLGGIIGEASSLLIGGGPTTTSSSRRTTSPITTSSPTTAATPTTTSTSQGVTSNTDTSRTSASTSSPVSTTPSSTTNDVLSVVTNGPSSTIVIVHTTYTTDSVVITAINSIPVDSYSASLAKSTASPNESGLTQDKKNLIAGLVGGIGGAILLGAIIFVIFKLKKRNRSNRDSYNDDLINDKNGAMGGAGANPFQNTLDQYHQPTGKVNTSANF